MSRKRRQRNSRRKNIPLPAILLALLVLGAVAARPAVSSAWRDLSENIPSLDKEEEYVNAQSTLIFDGSPQPQLIAVLNAGENRIVIPPEEIPEQMKQAIVVVEDDRCYQHSGVDPVGLVRALMENFFEGHLTGGGSTITQQYIKNTYVSTEPTLKRKFKEAVYAYQLEQRWSKDKILGEYLNTIYFGNGAYGLQMAALTYFGKPARELTLPECALLAAIPKSPSRYTPVAHPEAARGRRDLVLAKMLKEGMIDRSQYDAALAAPLPDRLHSLGPEQTPAPYFVEYVTQQLVARYGTSTTFAGGLRVYTTLDLGKQAAAEAAVAGVLNQPGDPAAALVSLEPGTSYVRALVGGRDFNGQKFNLATQGHRQPGSAFKPFVLAAALDAGIPPGATCVSAPKQFQLGSQTWKVANYDYVYRGKISLQEATVYSDNSVYSELAVKLGAAKVAETAHKAGIKTGFSITPAIALGGLDNGVTPLELASAYGTFANGGKHVYGSVDFEGDGPDPISIRLVTDAAGNVIDDNQPVTAPALDPIVTYHVNQVLGEVAHRSTRWGSLGRPDAGKSGTTEDHVDAWFSGYTPDLVTTVWIGYPDQRRPMLDVRGVRVNGVGWPAQIWHDYMQAALAGTPAHYFPKPPGADLVPVIICSDSEQPANPWCPHKELRGFLPGHVPKDHCTLHQPGERTMPNLVHMHFADAWNILEELGFEVELEFASDGSRPPDEIVDQEPDPGSKIMQGEDKIRITVAGAPGSVTLPEPQVAG